MEGWMNGCWEMDERVQVSGGRKEGGRKGVGR